MMGSLLKLLEYIYDVMEGGDLTDESFGPIEFCREIFVSN